jgi:DNA mismatch endonuclease (patch repair protein)
VNVKGFPGKPDLVLDKYKAAIFVNGCFWHQHLGCKRYFIPKTNVDYWTLKLEGNAKRDEKNMKELQGLGFRVLVIWECTLKDIPKLQERISKFLRSP